jgi:catechol 2,3-dioxygenase-like lactoylglutathione lyase family enzyme
MMCGCSDSVLITDRRIKLETINSKLKNNNMKPAIRRLDHIQLCVPVGKEEEARAFYRDVLGLKEIEKPEALKANGGLWFEVADIQLHIGVESLTGSSKRHPAFEVKDLAAVKEYLRGKDVPIKEVTAIPGCDRFSFLDPFNNRIEFLEKH